jgi:hypothetical protein
MGSARAGNGGVRKGSAFSLVHFRCGRIAAEMKQSIMSDREQRMKKKSALNEPESTIALR